MSNGRDEDVLVNVIVAALRQELVNFSANFNRNDNDNTAVAASNAAARNRIRNDQDADQDSRTSVFVYNGNSWLSRSGNH
ncbi:MAG: hypothetical protein ABS949_08575 [Solibacillus sp.]